MMNNDFQTRYHRQMILPGFGEEGQNRLGAAKILVAGAGGLGCPALQYLAAAGVGTIGIVDHDRVSLSNLHRQVLYTTADIGMPKAETAAEKLRMLNPSIKVVSYPVRLSPENAFGLIRDYEIIIDGTDNFPTRYMISDACELLKKPLIYGAVSQFEGQIGVFNLKDKEGKCLSYRDLFPKPPAEGEVPNCAQAGVIGTLPGMIGMMQASEAIKLITGIGQPLINRILIYNSNTSQTYEIGLQAQARPAATPVDEASFIVTDYEDLCCGRAGVSQEIDKIFFENAIETGGFRIIDVREAGEGPQIDWFEHTNIPLSELEARVPELPEEKIILFCATGKRSLQALNLMTDRYPGKEIYSLKGGLSDLI